MKIFVACFDTETNTFAVLPTGYDDFSVIKKEQFEQEPTLTQEDAKVKFSRVKAPSHADMEHLVHVISHRIAAYLERAGLIERDTNSAFLDLPLEDEDGMLHLQAASVNYRIAVGKDIGKKVFTLQTLPAQDEDTYGQLAQIDGFSLHAGVFADTHQAQKLERLDER